MELQKRFDSILGSLACTRAGLPAFLLGVSGGVDSMTLATLFAGSALKPEFEVAHMNFSLRGGESDGDMELVRAWCKDRGVTFHTRRVDTAGYAASHGISIEMAARELRYGWFATLSAERGLQFTALAHNLNDNVETLFLNLLRGCGLKGACGMKVVSGRLFRPLLEVSREQIEAFARAGGVPWRVDSSNLESDYSRNRIRNEVMPHLTMINPSCLESISRSMAHFAQAQQVLDSELERRLATLPPASGDSVFEVPLEILRQWGDTRYWIFRLFEKYGADPTRTADLASSLDSPGGKRFETPDYVIIKTGDSIRVYPRGAAAAEIEVELTDLPPDGFDPRSLPPGTLCADADLLNLPLGCRFWRDGDRFRPFGMRSGSRLLSDFFTDLKFDIEQKRRTTVVTTSGGDGTERIVCILGLRLDDRFRITSRTRRIALIRPRRND